MTLSVSPPGETAISPQSVYRPVQYLGSKLRSLPAIVDACAQVTNGPGAWDAFTGSSVVAQGLSQAGLRVTATDTQKAAATFATALLSVGRPDHSDVSLVELAKLVRLSEAAASPWADFIRSWALQEQAALTRGDVDALRDLYERLPQRGRPAMSEQVANVPFDDNMPMSSTFAGSYFGIGQALRLDQFRRSIRDAVKSGMRPWYAASLLTALCSAASSISHSAGKHFAQPLGGDEKNANFRNKRMLQDRSLDVDEQFMLSIAQQSTLTHMWDNAVECRDALNVDEAWLRERQTGVVYADPPYTAQQYSRFYHALDTLVMGINPPLQLVNGAPTRGLYPESRYLSPFCSRTKAAYAFDQLTTVARAADAAFVLSYSTASEGSKNARMIELEELVGILRRHYGRSRVEVRALSHHYRDFNQKHTTAGGRRSDELLLIGRPR